MPDSSTAKEPSHETPFGKAHRTANWALTMTKVGIRQAVAHAPFPHWHLLAFSGPGGRESRGIVDLIAIRKDHSTPGKGLKRGDALQIILIQVKGGSAPQPTAEDAKRLRIVARRHGACAVLLAAWKKGKGARFYSLRKPTDTRPWSEITDLGTFFRRPPFSQTDCGLMGYPRCSSPDSTNTGAGIPGRQVEKNRESSSAVLRSCVSGT